jgi:cholest-4-en-3-one 26-monooxygenase
MVQMTDIRLSDPDAFVGGVPHDLFRRMRNEAPVCWVEPPAGPGFWAITKYRDVITVSQDSGTFSSSHGTNIEDAQGGAELMMLNMDPPRHTKLRNLVSKGFTPKLVRAIEPHVREIAKSIVDDVAQRGACDFVTEVAAELPLQVIAELIGIPIDERHSVFNWSNQMIGLDDPEYGNSIDTAMQAATNMFTYANTLAAERRQQRKDDLVSVLIDAEVDGEQLSDMEFNFFFLLLAVAGNETTRNLISGGMLALIEHPKERERLRTDLSLMPAAVEEMLRWVTPVMYFRRTAMRDTELGGKAVKEGERVTMWYVSANRDEEAFPNADRFDVRRDPNAHVAFGGGGVHFCLGASLARLEIRVIFEELLRRLPDVELAGPVARLRSNFISGIKHMPVTFTPERA